MTDDNFMNPGPMDVGKDFGVRQDDIQQRLEAIRARVGAATGGPWQYGGMVGDPGKPLRHFVAAENEKICLSEGFAVDYAGGDKTFEFIAHAREDVPWLLERVDHHAEAGRACEGMTTEFLEQMTKQGGLVAVIEKTSPHYRGLRDDNEKLRELLRNTYDAHDHCGSCGTTNPDERGHKPGCELAKAIGVQP